MSEVRSVPICITVPALAVLVLTAGPAAAGTLGTGFYRCTVDISSGSHDCTDGIVTVTSSSGSQRVVQVDLNASFNWLSLNLLVDLCSPTGWTMNIGDSPTNNGGGGDGVSTQHDSEAEMNGTTLGVYYSDVGGTGSHTRLLNAMASSGCFFVQWAVTQDQVTFDDDGNTSDTPRLTASGSLAAGTHLFDFPPYNESDSEDPSGTYADKLFVGLNRSIGTSSRSGTGVQSACFFLSTSASPNPATIAAECGL